MSRDLKIYRLCFRNLEIKNYINILATQIECNIILSELIKEQTIPIFVGITKTFYSCLFNICIRVFVPHIRVPLNIAFGLVRENDATGINEMKVAFFIFYVVFIPGYCT